ncbi:MAG: hypothetical protein ACP5D2_04720 [Candidatus Nanoarchaeia archaeon]
MKQISYWLGDRGVSKKQINLLVTKLKHKYEESMNDNQCILCRKQGVGVCSYCFFFDATRLLEKMKFNKRFIRKFIAVFSYHKWYEPYYPEEPNA